MPEEYWTIDGIFHTGRSKKPVEAHFYGQGEKKIPLNCKEDVDRITEALNGAAFSVTDIKVGERFKKAPFPFTTSTLQQEASRQLNFSIHHMGKYTGLT